MSVFMILTSARSVRGQPTQGCCLDSNCTFEWTMEMVAFPVVMERKLRFMLTFVCTSNWILPNLSANTCPQGLFQFEMSYICNMVTQTNNQAQKVKNSSCETLVFLWRHSFLITYHIERKRSQNLSTVSIFPQMWNGITVITIPVALIQLIGSWNMMIEITIERHCLTFPLTDSTNGDVVWLVKKLVT